MQTGKLLDPELAKVNATEGSGLRPFGEILERLKQPFLKDAELAAKDAAERQLRERIERERFRRQLPERYAKCTLENWRASSPFQVKVKAVVTEWAGIADGAGLVLFGPVGTGKDHLAVAAIDVRCQRSGQSAMFVNGREFAGEVRDRIDDESPESSLIGHYRRPGILLISDPLAPIGDLTQHQADMLYRVVESRYSTGKVTCCTLNVKDDDEADRRLGAATWDRLCDGAVKIFCRWGSFRKPVLDLHPKTSPADQ